MFPIGRIWFALMLLLANIGACATPVLLVSIDGLRPSDVLQAEQRGLRLPNLHAFVVEGSYSTGVRGVLPTLTYPSHTTLLTGVAPARHGIFANLTFDPTFVNQQGWYWYSSDIRVPTLWDAAHAAGLRTASVHWPVSVGANIDSNLPQIWRTGHPDDRKLLAALATPGLLPSLEKALGPYADGIDESVQADESRARFAASVLRQQKPDFMTVYLASLDHEEHVAGPDTPPARAVLERIDRIVGQLVTAAHETHPDGIVAIVSDHGFAPLAHDVNLYGAFIHAGLLTVNDAHKVTAWDAVPWHASGSAAIVLREPADKAIRGKVTALLDTLRADPANGIADVLDRPRIAAAGGNPQAEFFVLFKPGYQIGADPSAAMVTDSHYHGMHGYSPDVPAMNATFLIAGRGIPRGRNLGDIDMRDIAPTLAALLGARLPDAEGQALLGK
jgi:predicted AlkP superfamily pyrophosphatase or phosphodiesterase